MLKNYFYITWRNLWRNKLFAIIKIMGLSLGLMVCILIFLYTKDEVSYDQFHENKSRLFRIIQTWEIGKDPEQTIGTTNAVLGETFQKEIPEIQQYMHLNGFAVTVKGRNNNVFTETPFFVDENFFSVFTFPLLQGSRTAALKDVSSVVVSEAIANKYFGTTDAIGKTIQLKINEEFENFTVSAIAKNPPQNSTLKAGIFLPFRNYEKYNDNKEWLGGSMNTFLLLSPQANRQAVESKMQLLFDNHTKDDIAKIKQDKKMAISIKLALQPLTAIHLSTVAGPDNGMTDASNPTYSYILTGIAVLILVIACINFVNLAIGQSLKRSREIGIRKVLGSTRRQLILQFLAESFFVSVIAFMIAVFLAIIMLPFFNELSGKKLSLYYLFDSSLVAGFFIILVVTAFLAGFYPSMVLSAFQPVKVLYSRQKIMGKNYLMKTGVVLQFALAIFLIIGTIAINSQLKYLSAADLGYNPQNLVRIVLPIRKSSDKLPGLFKNELSGQPGILAVAAKNGGRSISGVFANGKGITIEKSRIDENYLPTFEIPVIAGRNFSPAFPSDTMNAVIVNESFVREAGWQTGNAVGKVIYYRSGDDKSATIVGVVKDFHFESLKEKVKPALFTMDSNFNYGQLWVKIRPGTIPQTLSLLQNTFRKIIPGFPYSYQFMSDLNAESYDRESKWEQIIGIASALFIFIACIGLLGLVNLFVEQRRKEIGIRKVLGAVVSRIVMLISKEFVILISVAFAVAVPMAYYVIDRWLENFAYRVQIGWWIFAIAGFIAVLIAVVTISIQAIKAAMANPVKSLRME